MSLYPRELFSGVSTLASRTPTLPPATHTNSYAIGTRDVLLVEPATPYEDEQRAWLEWARALRSSGREPLAIVLTHHHADHVGGAALFAKELSLPIWAHAQTAEQLPDLQVAAKLADKQEILLHGPTPMRWHVLHTPGHAAGHVCLYEAMDRTILVGDMVASVGTILIAPGKGEGHMATYLAQLARLEGLGASVALPAHGAPIEDPVGVFRKTREHRLMREGKVLAAATSTPGTAEELLPAAYSDVAAELLPFALLSLRAHLEKLVDEGRVALTDDRYRATT
ncbi:MAG: MBL fold metallo-hydrolase [Myxococcales bacterium]|nr:MBL fold metallo-hydrolase [Myxococcales bacterium]